MLRIAIDRGAENIVATKRPRPPGDSDPLLDGRAVLATGRGGGDEDGDRALTPATALARSPPSTASPPPQQATNNTRPSKRIALRLQREAVDREEEPASGQHQQRSEAAKRAPPPLPPPGQQPRRPARSSLPPVSGVALAARLAELQRAAASPDAAWPPGSALWVRVAGFTHPWPGCVWSLDLCRRQEVPAILLSAPRPPPSRRKTSSSPSSSPSPPSSPSPAAPAPPTPLLMRWYGEHSSSWVAPRDVVGPLALGGAPGYARRAASLSAYARRSGCGKQAEPALREAGGALGGGREAEEAQRVRQLGYARALALQAKKKKGEKQTPPPRSKKLLYARWRAGQARRKAREELARGVDVVGGGGGKSGGGSNLGGGCWLLSAAERAAGVGSAWAVCPACGDDATDLLCGACGRAQHALCARPPVLGRAYVREQDRWACAGCGAENAGLGSAAAAPAVAAAAAAAAAANEDAGATNVILLGDDDVGKADEGAAAAEVETTPDEAPARALTPTPASAAPAPTPAAAPAAAAAAPAADARMGLTPAWLISTLAYKVFQLWPPTADRPFVAGLMDPCCNDKARPNVPAEVCYDRRDDGLAARSSWQRVPFAYVNPPFCSTVQWRFVNRCSDEIENSGGGGGGSGGGGEDDEAEGRADAAAAATAPTLSSASSSPPRKRLRAIALLCRNSTDTGFFQRLRCFPRVFFRRNAVQFSDYTKNPIGFGICCFLLVPLGAPSTPALIERFYSALSPFGEAGVAVDAELVRSPVFAQLLGRLKRETERDHRDHWAQCADCARWRVVEHGTAAALRRAGAAARWTCAALLRPGTRAASCRTPLTRAEALLARGPGPDGEGRQGAAAGGNNTGGCGGYDWRRKAVVRTVVGAIFKAVLRHGEDGEVAVGAQNTAADAAAGDSEEDGSDADVPLLKLQQRAQRLGQEREQARRERERRDLLAHLRPGMPAARLLGPLVAAAAAVAAERSAREEEEGAGGGPGGAAAAERAQRLADLYLAASLAARKLVAAAGGGGASAVAGQSAVVSLEDDDDARRRRHQEEDADAVARALLPGCPAAACRAALAPPGPLPLPPPALVRQRGRVLASLTAAYLCRAQPSHFPAHDGARAALRAALLRPHESGGGALQAVAAAGALKLLASWLLTPRPPPSPTDLGGPMLLVLQPLLQGPAASCPAGREVAPSLGRMYAAAARALAPSAALFGGEDEEEEEEEEEEFREDDDDDDDDDAGPDPDAAVGSEPPPPPPLNDDDDDDDSLPPPSDLSRDLLAERAVLTAPDASCRRVLLAAPDLLLSVAALWREEAAFAARLAAARAARQRSKARRAIGACLLSIPAALAAPQRQTPLSFPLLLPADLASLSSAAGRAACPSTLERCTTLPEGVAKALDAAELARERARQQRALEARLRGGEDEACDDDDDDERDGARGGSAIERACARVVDPLDLARYARSAATQAVLSGLGLEPSAMAAGLVPAVAPGDPLVRLAFRRLAASCAVERCARRAARARRELNATEMARARVLRRCRDELRAASGEEIRAREALRRAEGALAAVVAEAWEREGHDGEREAAARDAAGVDGGD